jgi:hypothetical protein
MYFILNILLRLKTLNILLFRPWIILLEIQISPRAEKDVAQLSTPEMGKWREICKVTNCGDHGDRSI